jgi:Fur family ferric uptake transcriptional regulator
MAKTVAGPGPHHRVGPLAGTAQRAVTPQSDAEQVVAEVAGILRARGERMTGPRRVILTVLAAHSEHLGVEEVIEAVEHLDPSVHRSSVYRTLEALSQLGVVQHVHAGHGHTTYHLVRDQLPHMHAQCRNCGVVLDLPADLLDAVAARMSGEQGFVLDAGHVALSGTCQACHDTILEPRSHHVAGAPHEV